jgi:hypothetical protein
MSVKICYVSMAFGVKSDAEGRMVDHDRTYRELIMPAVQAAGLVCQRADDFVGSLIHKDIAKAVITADVMLADVSSGNSNVMYELGIRHGLRRDATVLLTSTHLPFNIAHIYALRYGVAFDGGPEPAQLGPFARSSPTCCARRPSARSATAPSTSTSRNCVSSCRPTCSRPSCAVALTRLKRS